MNMLKKFGWINNIRRDDPVRLPDGSYTKSATRMRNALREMDEIKLTIENRDERKSINFTYVLNEYDTDNKIADFFWKHKPIDTNDALDYLCELIQMVYDVDMDIHKNRINVIAKGLIITDPITGEIR